MQRLPPNIDVVGEIHTILGGIAGGGKLNSARKAYARRMQSEEAYSLQKPPKITKRDLIVLSFSKKDTRGWLCPMIMP